MPGPFDSNANNAQIQADVKDPAAASSRINTIADAQVERIKKEEVGDREKNHSNQKAHTESSIK